MRHDRDGRQQCKMQNSCRAGDGTPCRRRQGVGGHCGRRRHGYTEDGEQPGRRTAQHPGRQQRQRVQILRAAPQPPVQTARGAVGGPGNGSHDLARGDLRALLDQRLDGFVRRAQRRVTRTGEADGEHSTARDPAREGHPSGRRGPHRRACRRRQVHTAVAPAVGRGRRIPPAHDLRTRRPQRPAASPAGGRTGFPGPATSPGRGADRSRPGSHRRDQQHDKHPHTQGNGKSAVHGIHGPVRARSAPIMVRNCGQPAGCGQRRHPAPPGSRTLLLAIRVTGSTSHAPPPNPLRSRWPRSSVPCGTARRGVRT